MEYGNMMLSANLALATLMVGITTVIHFFGLAMLIAFIRKGRDHGASNAPVVLQGAAILFVVFGLFGLHTIEIWLYAILYMALGEFGSFEEALYFSTSAFTTVGFGDIYLDKKWRLLSAIEAASGFLLIGWSTAFLVSVTARIRLLEAEMDEKSESSEENTG